MNVRIMRMELHNKLKAGTRAARYVYSPCGQVVAHTGETADRTYTGHHWDPAAQLYFAPFRHYSPMQGRWTTRDPLGFVDGLNLYTYAAASPINYIDPTGSVLPAVVVAVAAPAVVGATAGAVFGGGICAASMAINEGSVDLHRVGRAAGSGAISGFLTGLGVGTLGKIGKALARAKYSRFTFGERGYRHYIASGPEKAAEASWGFVGGLASGAGVGSLVGTGPIWGAAGGAATFVGALPGALVDSVATAWTGGC